MIKELIQKFVRRQNNEFNEMPEKVSPDEIELNSYMERERKDRIKKMLNYYRKKKEYEQWHSKKILQGRLQKAPLFSRSIILKEGRRI